MPQKPKPEDATLPKKGPSRIPAERSELSAAELDKVSGGLPGKRKPPTL